MAQTVAVELEASIKKLPGVLGCVALRNPDGSLAEIQAFTFAGVDHGEIQAAIRTEASRNGLTEGVDHVFVIELGAESHLGDRESLHRAAELAEQEARARGPRGVLHPLGTLHSLATTEPEVPLTPARVPLSRVLLSASGDRTEAEVTLGSGEAEVKGTAGGDRSPHGVPVVAEATLQAVRNLLPGVEFSILDASPQTVLGREAVAVLVRDGQERDLLGCALVRDGPVSEAAVRATLDAINRRMTTER